MPAVSVVMPVRNVAPFLDASIGSIAAQTFPDFELVIVDDASDDGSHEIARRWADRDQRIALHRTETRLGVVAASNLAVKLSRTPLVARMDSDDLSHKDRLALQLRALEKRPDAVGIGALADSIDATGRLVRPRDAWRLLRRSTAAPFPHGSLIVRRSAFDELGGYREECNGWEDQDLLLRLSRLGPILVLPEVLYSYRHHAMSTSTKFSTDLAARIEVLRRRCVAEFSAGRDYTPLLHQPSTPAATGHAQLLRYHAAMQLWAGGRPRIFVDMLRDGAPAASLLWAAWASGSPSTLRSVTRLAIRARDLVAGFRVHDGKVYEWQLP